MKKTLLFTFVLLISFVTSAQELYHKSVLTDWSKASLKGKKILYIERDQYAPDHHNTATLFQFGEINTDSFSGGSAMRIYDVDADTTNTLVFLENGVVRDPEISFDGAKVLFSMRKNKQDFYRIYEMNIETKKIRQITSGVGASDIDPLYLPDGGIIFSSTRQPKYCMCNRHIMANLFRVDADGNNIKQLGFSTLFEGHAALMPDGRVMYDRWEYVDRNFGDAQGIWVINPDGTKHSIYYGNNTASPGGVIDAKAIPGTDEVVCIFSSCHERPWGAMAVIDRNKAVDGKAAVNAILPKESLKLVDNGDLDSFKYISNFYEDPYPIDKNHFLVSRTIWHKAGHSWNIPDAKSGIYLTNREGRDELIIEGGKSLFDPQIVMPTKAPPVIPSALTDTKDGVFYVQDVYEGTHMKGVQKGEAVTLRVVESPEKQTWTRAGWGGQGEQAPGVNWHSFENKRIIGEVPIEADGSANFRAPAGKHVFFQLLDKDGKMIQTMRSGVSLLPGEINGCIGCHDDRLQAPPMRTNTPIALTKKPRELTKWQGREPFKFSFMNEVQPILDRNCVKCHDFDPEDRTKLVLAKDKNMFFNAAYVNMYIKKVVTLIGGGTAKLQEPRTWGAVASKLTKIVESNHNGVRLNEKELEILYTWMDLNGVYYPVYESAFDNTMAGRSPLNSQEVDELAKLTGVNFWSLNNFNRKALAQVSFDRPEKSPCLDAIRADKQKYRRAVEIIKVGGKRLKETPRGDIEDDLIMCDRNKLQIENYIEQLNKL